MYVYYTDLELIYRFGPYGKNHCTCGTLAFKKIYFDTHKFPHKNKAEEMIFLDKYKNELIQINPSVAILVIAHQNNTVNKHKFIKYGKKTDLKLEDFNMTQDDKDFYNTLKFF